MSEMVATDRTMLPADWTAGGFPGRIRTDDGPSPILVHNGNLVDMPCGGADLRTGYATTARKGLDAAALARQPDAGNLFTLDPGVAGLPTVPATVPAQLGKAS